MKVVGLTGPSGAGKTTALRAAMSLGAAVFDCDRIYADLLKSSPELIKAIGRRFPGAVRGGALDRRALAAAVFNDPASLADLNSITHPPVVRKLRDGLSEARSSGAALSCVDAIALFESGIASLCDETVFVTAPRETRVERIMERDRIDRPRAEARVDAQKPDLYFEGLCDRKIVNNFPDSRDFFLYCQEFFRRYI